MSNEYRVITADYPLGLERKVKKALEAGFVLAGGVSVSSHVEEALTAATQTVERVYAQAMIHQSNT